MSSAPAPHGHDAHDAHAFTGEPTQVLPADEPRTPGWLPLLGIALFTAAAVMFLAGRDAAPAADAKPAAQAAAAEAPKPVPQPPPPAATMVRPQPVQPIQPAQPGQAAPAGGPAAPRAITPEQRDMLRKAMGPGGGKPAPRKGQP